MIGKLGRLGRLGVNGGGAVPGDVFIRSQFADGTPGLDFDFTDLGTMRQNSTGTTAMTVPGSGVADPPIGYIKSKVNSITATQSTDAKRPVLSGRYNRLVATEDLTTANWSKFFTAITTGQLAPDGTYTAIRLTETTGQSMVYSESVSGIKTGDKKSIWARAVSGTGTVAILGHYSYDKYRVTLTETWQLFEAVVDTTETGGAFFYTIDTRYGTLKDILVWHPDLRSANLPSSLPAYQSVTDANTYDTAGFPLRPVFNGATQFLKVETLDLSSTDAVTVFAGVRKLSDAVLGGVVSFGLYGENSSFILYYPSFDVNRIGLYNRGTAQAYPRISSDTEKAPISRVVSGTCRISTDTTILRINGTVAAASTTDLGSGNYGSKSVYIGSAAATTGFLNGEISRLTVIGKTLETPTIQRIDRIIANQMRLVL